MHILKKNGMQTNKKFRFFFWVTGFISLIWFVIRVIPKPSRAAYPCMRTSMPLASAFVIHILSLSGSIFLLGRLKQILSMRYAKYFIMPVIVFLTGISIYYMGSDSFANNEHGSKTLFSDPLGPNNPIGEAIGTNPGRVVWSFNPSSTNLDCIPYEYGDGYFLPSNSDQIVISQMLSESLQLLLKKQTDEDAWDEIFRYFNIKRSAGNRGYEAGERIFIKINSVHAWNTDSQGNMQDNDSYGFVDTSPQVVLAVLEQLIQKAGVPQHMIYVGDPFTKMFNHCFELWNDKYPDVHYLSRELQPGREVFTKTTNETLFYSDKGEIQGHSSDKMVDQIVDADYLINIPALKAHRWAGVTFFAKNHFGSHARGSSVHLHAGLHRVNYNEPLRDEYKLYRTFVDMMAAEHLGKKTLIYIMDGLWGTSEEHLPPVKFNSHPFNNHWSSSILVSQDPVAIESVCLDILQKEFQTENTDVYPPRYTFVQWNAVDDYLHQAASADWWPQDIIYDPNNTGNPIPSMGVHEHWNNSEEMQYSRNLNSGDGIELIKHFKNATDTENETFQQEIFDLAITPNPAQRNNINFITKSEQPSQISIELYDMSGIKIGQIADAFLPAGKHLFPYNTSTLEPGTYLSVCTFTGHKDRTKITKKLIIR